MINETQFKKEWHKSVIKYGGFSKPLACSTMSGIPDIFMVMPNTAPVLLEAKWLGKRKQGKWDCKIEYTTLQKQFLKDCHDRQPYSAMGLIGFEYDLLIYAIFLGIEHDRFKNTWKEYCVGFSVFDKNHGGFNIKSMFNQLQANKLYGQPINQTVTSMVDNPAAL